MQALSTVEDYNKDYTALLLNCYVKMKQRDKIQELIDMSEALQSGESIFDIDTAIEVCRQQEETLGQAEYLALKSKNYKLYVQIQIENKHDYTSALEVIDTKITNIKDKVGCLQQYVSKLLKHKHDSSKKIEEKEIRNAIVQKQNQQKKILEMVQQIAWALVDFTKHDKKFERPENKEKFTLKSHQKVRIEDLLQIFIDDLELVK